jgi:hypothetical protein
MVVEMVFVVFVVFIFGFLLDISINLRRLNNNVKKLIK